MRWPGCVAFPWNCATFVSAVITFKGYRADDGRKNADVLVDRGRALAAAGAPYRGETRHSAGDLLPLVRPIQPWRARGLERSLAPAGPRLEPHSGRGARKRHPAGARRAGAVATSAAEPGGICIADTVRDHVGDRLDLTVDDLGDQHLKNIARPGAGLPSTPRPCSGIDREIGARPSRQRSVRPYLSRSKFDAVGVLRCVPDVLQ
jgi:hypothetical protein